MADFDLMRRLARPAGGKIILLVMDGLGGLPLTSGGNTALERAVTPAMDRLAAEGCLGLSHPIARGVTPGSGPAHLALFGYDPVANPVGRGVLEGLGIGLDLGPSDVAARGNFCTVDSAGRIIDRRAGRISTEDAAPLVKILNTIALPGVETDVSVVREYRFMLVMRGAGLSGDIDDTDPQVVGKAPLPVTARSPGSQATAGLFQMWVDEARNLLKDEKPANMITLRGFGQDPKLPKFREAYSLSAACVAVYPMYKGVSRLLGMDVLPVNADASVGDEFRAVAESWDQYDFFFVHVKPTDSRGEDGDQEAKANVIQDVDAALPSLLDLKPDVLVITGDHSTPAKMRSHSWHPVPTLLWAPDTHLQDRSQAFGEREAQVGGLGHFAATELMPLALAHAGRLRKFGA